MPGNIRLYGTSGYLELSPPSSPGNVTLELPTDSIKPGIVKITDVSFSGVSTVSVNNCFSSTYDNYLVLFYASSAAAVGGNVNLRFRVSGSDNTDSTYKRQLIAATDTTVAGARSTTTSIMVGGMDSTDNANVLTLTVFRPYIAVQTSVLSQALMPADGSYMQVSSGYFDNTTVFDGFTLFPNTSTFTGTLRVYGYRN